MPKLPSKHHDLSAMMALVSNKIRQDVAHVERQVSPHVRGRAGDAATTFGAQREQTHHTPAAAHQGGHQAPPRYGSLVDLLRYDDSMLAAKRCDPRAPRIVKVSGNLTNRPVGSARYRVIRRRPKGCWEVLDEVDRDAVVRGPRAYDCGFQVDLGKH